jgi:hypothetical protein
MNSIRSWIGLVKAVKNNISNLKGNQSKDAAKPSEAAKIKVAPTKAKKLIRP